MHLLLVDEEEEDDDDIDPSEQVQKEQWTWLMLCRIRDIQLTVGGRL